MRGGVLEGEEELGTGEGSGKLGDSTCKESEAKEASTEEQPRLN